jgi:hypothetical protein
VSGPSSFRAGLAQHMKKIPNIEYLCKGKIEILRGRRRGQRLHAFIVNLLNMLFT